VEGERKKNTFPKDQLFGDYLANLKDFFVLTGHIRRTTGQKI
jgi:hypothetical protein